LEQQQRLVDPLQQILASGCHLLRHTDELVQESVTSGSGSSAYGGGGGTIPGLPHFSSLIKYRDYELGTQWPISRQVAGVLIK